MKKLINTKVKALAELGLTNTEKVRQVFERAVAQNLNRHLPNVLREVYFNLLTDFYNGSTEYC